MYEDEHLESDYEDRNGNLLEYDEYSLTNPDWDEYDEYDDLDEARYSGSWQDSDISNESDFIDF